VYISAYCRLVLVPPNFMKFGIRGQFTNVIICVKFLVDRFWGYGILTPPKLPFPIDLLHRPYNSVRTAVRHCDQQIHTKWPNCLYSTVNTWLHHHFTQSYLIWHNNPTGRAGS